MIDYKVTFIFELLDMITRRGNHLQTRAARIALEGWLSTDAP